MSGTLITSIHNARLAWEKSDWNKIHKFGSLVDISPSADVFKLSPTDMWSVLFKPEGKSIVQHTAFIYRAPCQRREVAGVMHAMKMSMVDLSDVKQHVPISLSRSKPA